MIDASLGLDRADLALAVASAGDLGLEKVALPTVTAPAIAPAPAPRYVPPVSVPLYPAPAVLPPPEGFYMGEGGTPFGARPELYGPVLYIHPPVVVSGWWKNTVTGETIPGTVDNPPNRMTGWTFSTTPPADYNPPPVLKYDPDAPAPTTPVLPPRRGEKQVMPVPSGQVPARPDAGEATPQVTPPGPGPVKGMFLGVDLSIVPLWAWLAGAALIGARVLKG